MVDGDDRHLLPEVSSLCFWSWNDQLDENELKNQLADFSQGNYTGVVIHSRAGLGIPYLGDEWFRLYHVVVEEAGRLGLSVWIYDEDGWPSGFAGGRIPALGEEHWFKYLVFKRQDFGMSERRLAAWRDGESIDPDTAVSGDLVCEYIAENHYVDLLNPETVQAFIDSTHERYKSELGSYFGNVIKGIFTDEPQIAAYPWSVSLEKAWNAKFGSSLHEQLYLLVEDQEGCHDFRRNFRLLVSSMLYHSYTKRIADWCSSNNLMLTGHFSSEDGLCQQQSGNCGVMVQYTAMQLPGIDHLGNRLTSPILMKQVSSVAHQYGKQDTLSETFGCAGWGISFAQLCWIWGRQSVLGITTPCFHLAPYSIIGRRKRDYPAFYFYQATWWPYFNILIDWINRLNALMKEGDRLVNTLVISPLQSVMATYNPGGNGEAEFYSSQFRQLTENLLDLQMDFEIGDETILSTHGFVEEGTLRVGAARYQNVIVAECQSLSPDVIHLLSEFSRQGGTLVYVGKRPKNMPVHLVVQNRCDALEKCIQYYKLSRPITVVRRDNGSIIKGVMLHIRKINCGFRVHIWTDEHFKGENAVLMMKGKCTASFVNLSSNDCTPLKISLCADHTVAELGMESKCNYVIDIFPLSDDMPSLKTAVTVPLRSWAVDPTGITLCEKNCLTIDRARVSVNDGKYTDEMPIISLFDWLKKEAAFFTNKSIALKVQYSFYCTDDWIPKTISVAMEDRSVLSANINGKPLGARVGWWIDKGIGEYDVTNNVKSGLNTVTLEYLLPPINDQNSNVKHETERNRFFYPVEPESIYIRGEFDVQPIGEVDRHCGYYSVDDQGFKLSPCTIKYPGDLTPQGLWFYRGSVEYSIPIKKTAGNSRLVFRAVSMCGALIQWNLGKHTGYLHTPPFEQDITDYLDGDTIMYVRVIGTNRNLFGPHHHIKGNNIFVGPSIFNGVKGFEDFVSPDIVEHNTWTDRYSFIPFGCDSFVICEYQTDE